MAARSLLRISRMLTSLALFHLPELCLCVCAPVETCVVFHVSAGSPVAVTAPFLLLSRRKWLCDRNAQRLAVCTLELGGHVICRVCIIFKKKKNQELQFFIHVVRGKKINLYLRSLFPEFPEWLNRRFCVLFFSSSFFFGATVNPISWK